MADIDVVDIEAELGGYIVQNQKEIRSWVYQKDELREHAETITRVKGEFPAYQDVMSHLVQEFVDEWNELGTAKFMVRMLKAYRQKVNMPITPHKVLASWKTWMHMEGTDLADMPVSRWIMERMMGPKVVSDINYLMGKGTFNQGTALFGDSMNGLVAILTTMLASENPFRIPLPVLDDDNIVGCVEAFEEMLPASTEGSIEKIYMSKRNLTRYKKRYRTLYGQHSDYDKSKTMYTWLGNRKIIGLSGLDGSDLIFATVPGNLIRLVDIEDGDPEITDIQKLDYKLKLFMEFVLGVDFWTAELTYVSDFGGLTRGLPTNHTLFYPETPTDVIAPV